MAKPKLQPAEPADEADRAADEAALAEESAKEEAAKNESAANTTEPGVVLPVAPGHIQRTAELEKLGEMNKEALILSRKLSEANLFGPPVGDLRSIHESKIVSPGEIADMKQQLKNLLELLRQLKGNKATVQVDDQYQLSFIADQDGSVSFQVSEAKSSKPIELLKSDQDKFNAASPTAAAFLDEVVELHDETYTEDLRKIGQNAEKKAMAKNLKALRLKAKLVEMLLTKPEVKVDAPKIPRKSKLYATVAAIAMGVATAVQALTSGAPVRETQTVAAQEKGTSLTPEQKEVLKNLETQYPTMKAALKLYGISTKGMPTLEHVKRLLTPEVLDNVAKLKKPELLLISPDTRFSDLAEIDKLPIEGKKYHAHAYTIHCYYFGNTEIRNEWHVSIVEGAQNIKQDPQIYIMIPENRIEKLMIPENWIEKLR